METFTYGSASASGRNSPGLLTRPEAVTRFTCTNDANGRVSSPGEFHPEALSEPYVNVSIHTAPIIQPGKVHQVTNAQTAQAGAKRPVRASVWHA